MKHSLFSRLLSAVLAVSMLLQLLPVQRLRITASAETINDESSEHDVSVVGEVESLREADAKHFLMSDGSYIAVSYGFPVHYESTDGSWEDIDNTISLNTTGSYGLNRSDASVSIANDLSETERKAVILHYFEGRSKKQTAEIMGTSYSNAHAALGRAEKKLHLILKHLIDCEEYKEENNEF